MKHLTLRVAVYDEFYDRCLCSTFLAVQDGGVNNRFQASNSNLLFVPDLHSPVTLAERTREDVLILRGL